MIDSNPIQDLQDKIVAAKESLADLPLTTDKSLEEEFGKEYAKISKKASELKYLLEHMEGALTSFGQRSSTNQRFASVQRVAEGFKKRL